MIRFIEEKGMISPEGAIERPGAKVAITTFSQHLSDDLLLKTGARPMGTIAGSVDTPIYLGELYGKKILVYQSQIGAPAAVAGLEEILASGVERVIAFGICGALVATPHQTLIVPDKAYRDEGTSYHYAPPSEYIPLPNARIVKCALEDMGLNALIGGVWTTDGFYRETPTRVAEMKDNGCVAVDMECSALQAAATFRDKEFYTFFITADSLADAEWQPNDIKDQKTTTASSVAVAAAISLACRL